MNNFPYNIRNYQPADFDKYVLLIIEAEKLEPTGRFISSQVIAEHLYFPEQNLFIIEIAGNFVGYMNVWPELTIGRVILNCWVHPEHRRRGLATKLLGLAVHRAHELSVKALHVNVPESDAAAKSVLSKLGFDCVRRYLGLKLDMNKVNWQDIDQTALGYRHLKRGEEDKLTQIQNRSFAGTWGYNLNTVEEVIYRTSLSSCSPEDIVLTYDGDKVTGYCWTSINSEGEPAIGERKGRIFMLGVDPDYRGRGVGRKALLAGLARLKSKNITAAELTVDSENKVACALYRSVGFEVRTSSLWYEKIVD